MTFDLGTPQTVQTALDAASSDGAGGVVVNFGGGNSLTFNTCHRGAGADTERRPATSTTSSVRPDWMP
ncbi:hypothetical protein [Rhodophyticola sp.]|uniref:hypothetical protein n=1 Tax=Rhodophyticola sp. TaxID=2680032 RepID=UPI003D277851